MMPNNISLVFQVTALVMSAAAIAQGQPAASKPAAAEPPGWERTSERLRDLTFAGDNAKVIAITEKIVAAHPGFAEGHARLGGAHESAARELARSNPALAEKHFKLAEAHLRHAFDMGGGKYPEATIRGLIDLYEYAMPNPASWKSTVQEALTRYPGEPVAHWYGVQLILREKRTADLGAAFNTARARISAAEPRLDYASLLIGVARDALPAPKMELIREARALAEEVLKKNKADRIIRQKAEGVLQDAALLQPK